ncbi:MAG TPA: hypothetical protein VER96_35705 [Polyangiaceae bacterium]|nr:hypothetical protein [Polyangiaceae bacterium]
MNPYITPPSTGVRPQMNELYEIKHVTVSIRRSSADVYAFVANGANLPRWASGLGHTAENRSGEWLLDGPLGKIRVRFAPSNDFGVLDHDVVLPSGQSVHNPLRVVPNGAGSELTFALFRLPDVSPEKFAEDAQWVARDLERLKGLLEA